MQDFRNLDVWAMSHALTLRVYEVTRSFPREEQYGITSQLRRACSSIPTNIAEGCAKQSDAEFRRYLFISIGSISETDYLLLLSRDLGYLDVMVVAELNESIPSIRRMLIAFANRLAI